MQPDTRAPSALSALRYMHHATLVGVWKLSFAAARHSALTVPKRIRFDTSSPSAASSLLPAWGSILERGSLSVPFMEGCSGAWQVAAATEHDDGAQRAAFIIRTFAQTDAEASELSFQGLFDGERIAGSVTVGNRVEGDFLCTRLFTFWGAPKVRAAG